MEGEPTGGGAPWRGNPVERQWGCTLPPPPPRGGGLGKALQGKAQLLWLVSQAACLVREEGKGLPWVWPSLLTGPLAIPCTPRPPVPWWASATWRKARQPAVGWAGSGEQGGRAGLTSRRGSLLVHIFPLRC